jgi:phosphoribosylformimino-5-aminoimidazole carboxamide ribotide isomerase
VSRFEEDAVALARRFAGAGAPWLHVVDLDGARNGRWRNLDVIAEITASVHIPVQAGGGARSIADVEMALERGVARVIVGTAAIESPVSFAQWAHRFGDHLVVSLDTRGEALAVRGWTSASNAGLLEVGQALRAGGARRFIHTSIERDGTLQGVDLAGLRCLQPLGLPVLVAGGIATLDDLAALNDAGAEGAIVGKAFLDGTLDLSTALRRS